jgi:bifunctional DNA-binding transcriptional regulator/antitoxin component of YhaV-PrlF toxin-antitoxin module
MESFITTVTQKGQITIPIAMRRKAKISTKHRVEVKYHQGKITVEKVTDLLSLGGTLKTKPGMDALMGREYLETHYS